MWYNYYMKGFLSILILLVVLISSTYAKEIPFTQDDRDRLIRVETKIEGLDKRIDDLNKRIDSLQTFMLWGFGILFGGMGILIGFVIWDRRTALSPAIRKAERLEEALRELAKKDSNVAEALRHAGLL
jgi:hypothetical protein